MTSEPRRPVTFAVDCGGTGIKAVAVDAAGEIVGDRHRVRTRYPSPPKELVVTVCDLAEEVRAQAGGLDRATIGFPGMVRGGVVHSTPHYVTEFGPFTEPRPELVQAWAGHDIRAHLESALGLPTRVL
ncbi:MAG TPA: ROK family protein, partial [Jiangellaceae bacterium]|nr:ROK family protein [Jiangellaceae bacterium]